MKSKKITLPILCFFSIIMINSALAEEGEFVYTSGERRDPMIPLVTPEGKIRDIRSLAAKSDIYLKGIIYDEKGTSYAIIEGKILKEGDVINGVKILTIEEDKVVILKNGQVKKIGLVQKEEVVR